MEKKTILVVGLEKKDVDEFRRKIGLCFIVVHVEMLPKLKIVGIDYMIGHDGNRYLLEVNHIPNVTVFPFVNEAFLRFAVKWVVAE